MIEKAKDLTEIIQFVNILCTKPRLLCSRKHKNLKKRTQNNETHEYETTNNNGFESLCMATGNFGLAIKSFGLDVKGLGMDVKSLHLATKGFRLDAGGCSIVLINL